MSEPVIRQRTSRLTDEFDRRTKQGTAPAGENDPLAELARLVGEPYDPLKDVFGREAQAAQPDQSHYARYSARRRETARNEEAVPRFNGDFAAIEAGLRGGIAPENEAPAQLAAYDSFNYGRGASGREQPSAYGHGEPLDHHGQGAAAAPEYQPEWPAHNMLTEAEAEGAAASTKRPMYLMAAAIAIGVVGIGGAYALKGRLGSSPREIKTITADASPTKVQPPSDNSDANKDTTAAANSAPQTADALVDRKEQPVDLKQAVQDNADVSRLLPGSSSGSVTDASSVAVPPSPGQVNTAMADPNDAKASAQAGGEQSGTFGLPDLAQPKRVRVVSVRPDGTIIQDQQAAPPAAQAPASAPVAAIPAGDATLPGASTPAQDAPAAAPPPASTRAAKVAAAKAAAKAKIAARALAKKKAAAAPAPEADDGRGAPVADVASGARQGASTKVAAVEPQDGAEPAAAGTGGWAVQVAAPSTEAEAKAISARLSSKFADALGGRRLGFRHVEVGGRSIYRVRVGSLARADATSLCEKLKASGGTCFIAKN